MQCSSRKEGLGKGGRRMNGDAADGLTKKVTEVRAITGEEHIATALDRRSEHELIFLRQAFRRFWKAARLIRRCGDDPHCVDQLCESAQCARFFCDDVSMRFHYNVFIRPALVAVFLQQHQQA